MDRAKSRVLVVSEIPTPYRLPLYRRLADSGEIDLEVAFLARTEPDRPWSVDEGLVGVPHRFLTGVAPTLRTRRNTFAYEINPGIVPLLERGRWDAVVVGGYSVLAEQVSIAWARARHVPYLLHSESHLGKPRPSWRTSVKRVALPRVVGRAAAGFAVGTRAAEYLEHYGLPRDRIRIVPNTIDVETYARAAVETRHAAAEVRSRLGIPERFVLYAGRLIEAKGIPELLAALELLGDAGPRLVVAGTGPLKAAIANHPRVTYVGFQDAPRLIELYALADATVVPSRDEPWGVVVNEALACGSPVVASDAVGAAVDLIRDEDDGRIVRAGDVPALAAALAAPPARHEPGTGPIARWTYELAESEFLEGISLALAR